MFNYSTDQFSSLEELSTESCDSSIDAKNQDNHTTATKISSSIQDLKRINSASLNKPAAPRAEPDQTVKKEKDGTFGVVMMQRLCEVGKASGTPVWLKGDRKICKEKVPYFQLLISWSSDKAKAPKFCRKASTKRMHRRSKRKLVQKKAWWTQFLQMRPS